MEDGDDSAADSLPELHATCAGLKAVCTTWAAALIEDSRKCCGVSTQPPLSLAILRIGYRLCDRVALN